ncbi:hypothetical protein GZL_01874 [Streptomyces sp. 769]|nr:hypothetical protein GZL_01874 [Streptomyces sp. 769]
MGLAEHPFRKSAQTGRIFVHPGRIEQLTTECDASEQAHDLPDTPYN